MLSDRVSGMLEIKTHNQMRNILKVASVAAMVALTGCHNSDDLKLIEDQARANDSIQSLLNEKSQALTEIADAVADFQQRVTDIKEKQGIVSVKSSRPEVSNSQLQNDIDAIAEEMEKNKKTIQSLRYSLSKNKTQSAEYQKIIDALQAQVDQQAAEIADLNKELEKRNLRISQLEGVVASTAEELQSTKDDLTATAAAKEAAEKTVKEQKTGYYIIDTEENLLAAHIIDSKGSVVATGKETGFSALDKTAEFSITLPSNGKKFKVLSKQAANRKYRKSFTLDATTKTLTINDPGIFWGADRYLVVMITKTE